MKTLVSILAAALTAIPMPGRAQQDPAQIAPPVAQAAGQQQQVPDIVLVDQQPSLKRSVEPVYPPEALAKHLEGKVWLKVLIDTAGIPVDVQLLKTDNDIFTNAAMTAARQFTFHPALKDKKPVAVWVTFPFKFKLADKETGERSVPDTSSRSGSANIWMDKVHAVFTGDATARNAIDPEAYLVDGKRFVSLHEALFGKDKGKCFTGERSRKQEFMKISLSDDRNTATLVLETVDGKGKDPHWHTITWARKQDAEWKITHWHMSR